MHQKVTKETKSFKMAGFVGARSLCTVRDRWRTLYKLPVEKRTADLQRRIIHGAIATDRLDVAHLNPSVGGQCRFCGEGEDLEHLILNVVGLNILFELHITWFQGFTEEFQTTYL